MEKYTTLLQEIRDSKDWALMQLLEDLDPPKRTDELEKLFYKAISFKDEVSALKLLPLMNKSLIEAEIAPLLTEHKGAMIWNRHNPEASEAITRARQKQIPRLKEWYAKLAGYQLGKAWELISQDEGRFVEVKQPVMVEVKKFIIMILAEYWRTVSDEKMSDDIFEFLVEIIKTIRFDEERKNFLTAIREETRQGFPADRLIRHICHPAIKGVYSYGSRNYTEEMKSTMLIAWARNTDHRESTAILKAIRPLAEHLGSVPLYQRYESFPTLDLMGKLAQKIALMESKARSLVEYYEKISKLALSQSSIKKTAAFPDIGIIALSMELTADTSSYIFKNAGVKDWGEGWFQEASSHIADWQKNNPGYTVNLEVTIKTQYSRDPVFSKKDKLPEKKNKFDNE